MNGTVYNIKQLFREIYERLTNINDYCIEETDRKTYLICLKTSWELKLYFNTKHSEIF